jgi:uncharacterized cofD-like protein
MPGPKHPRIACVGGGHGLSAALRAARRVSDDVTAIVTAADDGGSSGVLRKHLGIPAPGDLRMAIAALAPDPEREFLIQYRPPDDGTFTGHPIGNTLIAALAQHHGNFARAVREVAQLVGCVGSVLPAAIEPVELCARVAGHEIVGQVAIARGPAAVDELWLDPAVPANPEAVDALLAADLVVLGPGSLFTSLIAALLPKGFAEAVAAGQRVVFVMNLGEQDGETLGLDAAAHVAALRRHVPGIRLDAVLIHDGSHEGVARPILIDEEALGAASAPVVYASLVAGRRAVHDPVQLADALRELLR